MAVFKSLAVLCLVFVSSLAACPDDGPYIEGPTGHCYRVVTASSQGSSWQAARSLCANSVGSDLVVIDNPVELDWLVKVIGAEGDPGSSWWIGYSDISRDYNWRWTDCQATTEWHQALWASGNLGNGDCGVLRMDGKIDSTTCETPISNFVCEITPKAFALESLTAESLTVTSLSTTSLEVTWSMPSYSCDVVAYRIYYAAADSPDNKKSVSVNSGNARRTVIDYLQPSTTYRVSLALYVSTDTELQETVPVEAATDTCPDGYELGPNGHCYWFYESTYGDMWHYARGDCIENDDSDLLIIDDEEELEFVLNKTLMMNTSSSRDWWIGFSDTSVAGDWRWTDCNVSTSWQADLWEPGPPAEQRRGCGALTANGTIRAAVCDAKHHFICEIQPRGFTWEDQNVQSISAISPLTEGFTVSWTNAQPNCDVYGYKITYQEDASDPPSPEFQIEMGGDVTSAVVGGLRANQTYNVTLVALVNVDIDLTEVGPVQVTTDPCPANYELGPNGHCYWFYESTYGDMWHYARRDCVQDADSDLLIIDDEEELEFVLTRTSMMNTSSSRDWWIGYSDTSVAGDWRWTDCDVSTSWQADLWEPGPPAEQRRGCGALTANGTIRAAVCDAKHHFICEIQPRGFDWYDQNVRDVSADPFMYGSTVSWTNADTNCDVYGYKIEYRENVQDSDILFSIAYGGNVTSALVNDLRPNRTYSMTVAALLSVDLELSPVGPALVTTPPCPAEYDYEEGPNGHCYRFRILDDGTRWQRGRQTCDNVVDSDYVIINDEEELRYLVNRSAEFEPEMSWWIGLSDLSVPADWRWIDCTSPDPWQEGLWAPGYPTRLDVGTCAALRPSGDVVDLYCDTRLSYICELLSKGFSSEALMVHNVTTEGASNSIRVMWELPEDTCDIVGYRLSYERTDGQGGRQSADISGGGTTSGAIRDLTVRTSYSITVSIVTSKEAVLSETEAVVETTVSCPDEYEEGPNGHCYRFHIPDPEEWWSWARGSCGDVEFSDLLVINDAEELEFVMNRTSAVDANMTWWIGYSDQSVEGDWRWLDCEQSDDWQEGLWARGYPGNGVHDCAALRPTGDVVDLTCDSTLGYVCEIAVRDFDFVDASVQDLRVEGVVAGLEVTWTVSPTSCDVAGYRINYQLAEEGSDIFSKIVYGGDVAGVSIEELPLDTTYRVTVAAIITTDEELPPVGPATATTLICPDNYEEGPNGHCYRFRILDNGAWWPTGRRTCDNVANSDLAIINDPEELAYLVNRSSEVNPNMTWWVGLSDLAVGGDWRWVDCNTPTSYQQTLWAPNYPTDQGYTCAALQPSGDLINIPCDGRISYLCELWPKGFDLESKVVQNVAVTGGMYSLNVTWEVPEPNCDFVGYKIYYQPNGDEFTDIKRSVFISGVESTSGMVTGLRVNASYSVTVAIYTSKDTELDESEPLTGTTSECPTDYEEGPNGRCYRFRILDNGSWWPTGRRTCDNVVDSDLVIINDPDELGFLVNRSKEINPNMTWWVGLSDLAVEGDWRWVDCTTPTSYQQTLWAPNYPTDQGYTCVALQPDGNLINIPCDRRFSYICELWPKDFDLDGMVVENVAGVGGTYSIDVTWTLPPNSCNSVGYKIYYELADEGAVDKRSVFVSGSEETGGVIRGLQANTSYDVTVAIYTSKDVELNESPPITASSAPCHPDYEEGPNGRCYLFLNQDRGEWWPDSRQICDDVADSDLVIINDDLELEFLLNRTAELDPSMTWWIGFSDQSVEGEWAWVDCQSSSIWQDSLWAPGYPGNGEYDCGALRPTGRVEDRRCDDTLSAICEISPKDFSLLDANPHDLSATGISYGIQATWTVSPTSCDVIGYKVTYRLDEDDARDEFLIVYGGDADGASITGLMPNTTVNVTVSAILSQDYELYPVEQVSATALPCPDGYEEGPNHRCYQFVNPEYGYWWPTGRNFCDEELDSDLAILSDQEELDYLLNVTATLAPDMMWWIGYSDQANEGDWRWLDCTESSDWQNALWAPNNPGNGRLDCAALQPDGQITSILCDTSISFLCEVSPRGFSQDDANVRDLVAVGTSYGVQVTWTVSPTSCDVVAYRIYYNIAGDISTRKSIIVYGADTSSALVSGLPVDTEYEIRVAAYLSKDVELSPVGPAAAKTLPCPSNYELAPNGRCYRFVDDDDDFWHYGRSLCMGAADSDLTIVSDEAELAYIMNRINASGDSGAWWIGYSDISVEGDWRWVDCTAPNDWQTSLWAPGSPGNGMLDCAALQPSGEIEAKVCDLRLNVVCEVSPKGYDRYELQVENLEVVGSSYGFKASWDLPAFSCDIYGFTIYYRVANESDVETKIVYGGDVTSAQVTNLRPNTTVTVGVAILIVDSELAVAGGITVQTDPCPPKYHEAPNGHCYYFSDFGRNGKGWDNCRSYCNEDTGNFDHDLLIIDDEWELEYVTNMTRMFNDNRDWWLGYSDLAVESSWKWVTCESPDAWQESLWGPGYPGNGLDDCGLFDPANVTIYDDTCDVPNINFMCEVTPKSFAIGDDNVRNLNATAISWDTIRVTWNVSEFNCDVIAYLIYYLDTEMGGTPTREIIYGGGVTSYDIQGLWASTRYSVSVAAVRTDSELPAVDPVYVTTLEGPCPAYYDIGTNGGCYRFFTSTYGTMWTSGRDDCDDTVDSDLVVIDDEMELEYILNRTRAMDSARDWWIGLSDISVESDWRWVTCDAPTDWQNTLWGLGYPSSALNDCAALNAASGEVVDASCDERKYFVCEVTPKEFTNADMNVRGTEATPLSLSQIKISWSISNITCNVYGYKVYYETSEASKFVIVYGGNETSVTVEDLTPSTTYLTYVAALIPDRLELPRIGPANVTTLSECGRTDISEDGTIQNPDYPNGYPGGETCDWLISAPTNQFVLLQITDFDTKPGVDFVVIGSGNDFDPTSTLYTLTGSKDSAVTPPIPDKVLSPGQYLWVSFRTSQSTTEYSGFQMMITMVTQGPATPDRDYVETTQEGVLSSPGWPNHYDNLQDITWTLIAPKSGRVRITSLQGSLEDGYDTLTIGSGEPDSNELATYTGVIQFNGPLESETYAMWVRFTADETISDTGFTLFWESFDDQSECGTEELTDPTGVITSPSYPNPYPDNQICIWEIRLPDMTSLVRVEFTAFSLEENEDFLQVGSGQTVGENVVASLTGHALPSPVESATYRMWLRFLSDESFSDTGFSLNYFAVDNPDPPTPYDPEIDSVLFIVQDEPVDWFTPSQQNNLANAIAQSMTDFCAGTSCEGEPEMAALKRRDVGTLALEFSADDVEFLSYSAVQNDLHIITWIQNPDTAEDDVSVGVDPDIVMTALLDENSQTTMQEYMGESFSYDVTHVPETIDPTTPPPEGLEPWAIALIAVGSLAVIVGAAVTLEVMHRRRKRPKRDDPQFHEMSAEDIIDNAYDLDNDAPYAVPHSSYRQNKGFEDENEQTKL